MKKDIKDKSLRDIAGGLIKRAEQVGLDQDHLFLTTYRMLLTELDMLDALEKSFLEDGATCEKEYVRGSKNLYVSPSCDKFAKISDSALKKIQVLEKMLNKVATSDDDGFDDF